MLGVGGCQPTNQTIFAKDGNCQRTKRSLRTEQTTLPFYKVTDIDQTDLHRFEPSSRTLLWDEHSHQ